MAHSISARKRIRQNEKRRMRNRAGRSALKSKVRGVLDALPGGPDASADGKLRDAVRALDRQANKGLIHRNTAARRKSRLMKRMNAAKAKRS